jgi:hypothetical protein
MIIQCSVRQSFPEVPPTPPSKAGTITENWKIYENAWFAKAANGEIFGNFRLFCFRFLNSPGPRDAPDRIFVEN